MVKTQVAHFRAAMVTFTGTGPVFNNARVFGRTG
jgi:hypothetical protein